MSVTKSHDKEVTDAAGTSEPAGNDLDCEIRLGIASWDDGTKTAKSVKYTWFDKNGKAARGANFPLRPFPKHSSQQYARVQTQDVERSLFAADT
ncbi:MAG: hypothetical protein V2B18_02170 [Pseudomonadota bacterium]